MKKDNQHSGEVIQCTTCGKSEELHWNKETNEKLFNNKDCFTCGFWRDHFENDLHRSLRIKGSHYIACEEVGPDRWRGHGGHKFRIRKFDGTVIETTNLWHQGEISKEWKDRLPDNAEMI